MAVEDRFTREARLVGGRSVLIVSIGECVDVFHILECLSRLRK